MPVGAHDQQVDGGSLDVFSKCLPGRAFQNESLDLVAAPLSSVARAFSSDWRTSAFSVPTVATTTSRPVKERIPGHVIHGLHRRDPPS